VCLSFKHTFSILELLIFLFWSICFFCMEEKRERPKKKLSRAVWPKPYASGWPGHGRLRGPISPLSVINSDEQPDSNLLMCGTSLIKLISPTNIFMCAYICIYMFIYVYMYTYIYTSGSYTCVTQSDACVSDVNLQGLNRRPSG